MAKAGDEEVAVAGPRLPSWNEPVAGQAPPQQLLLGGGEKQGRPRAGKHQVCARTQHPGDLRRRWPAADLGDEVEEVIWIRQAGWLAELEGDPALGVEADPGDRGPDKLRRGIGAANPRRRKLTGKKEDGVALAALDHQGTLGDGNVQHRGGEGSERGRAHGADHRKRGHRGPMF